MSSRASTLKDQVIWITGASSGIGEALAVELAGHGARLILSARRPDALERVAARCGGCATVLPLDLCQPSTLPAKADEAWAIHGHIDTVVHNAGLVVRDLAQDIRPEADRLVMEANYFGPVALTKALLPRMLARGTGRLVVISSLSGKYGVPKLSAYAAAKHALHGFFDSLRTEVHHKGIRILVVVPGFVNTPLGSNALDGTGASRPRTIRVNDDGISPERCARGIVRAMRRDRSEVVVGGPEAWSVLLYRLFPGMTRRLMRNNPMKRLRSLVGRGRPG